MGISVTEIQSNLQIWACCNQIQQYSRFIIYAMCLMFNKKAEICVAILDDRLFFVFLLLY